MLTDGPTYTGYTRAELLAEQSRVETRRRVAREKRDRWSQAACLWTLGDLERTLGHTARARRRYSQAVSTARAGAVAIGALRDLAVLEADDAKDPVAARTLLRQALRLDPEPREARELLRLLGEVELRLGHLRDAAVALEEANRSAVRAGDTSAEGLVLLSMAEVHRRRGLYDWAAQLLEKAQPHLHTPGSRARWSLARARLLASQGQDTEAGRAYADALGLIGTVSSCEHLLSWIEAEAEQFERTRHARMDRRAA